MISKSLKNLLARAGSLGQLSVAAVLGSLVALSVPLLALLLGGILSCLVHGDSTAASEQSERGFAVLMPDPSALLGVGIPPLARASYLLVAALAVLVLNGLLLSVFYRLLQSAAVAFEVTLIERLRQHAKQLATVRTLSAQQQALTDCLAYHLPRVRSSLSRWWRTSPRHFVQLVACVLVAILIQPMLAVLTCIATGVVVLVYRFIDRMKRTKLPVVRERAAQHRGALIDLSLKGPLLASVHDEAEVERRFNEQLTHYRQEAYQSLASSSWKTPTVVLTAGLLGCLFLFVISVQILGTEGQFSVAGAFAFVLCLVGAAVSSVRIQRTLRDLRSVETAAEELENFLSIPVESLDGDDLKPVSRVTTSAVLDHVTVQDSRGRKLLDNVSATFKPGQLIGVVSSQRLQAHALVELLMGFGRPVSGRMLIDDQLVTDLSADSLAKCAHWVAADGALVTGSVRDNLVGLDHQIDQAVVDEAVRASCLSESIQQLPDGVSTIITPADDRLVGDAPFRVGVARAALRNKSVLVIEEPEAHYDQQTEQQSLAAIRSLVKHNAISVVLPQRLLTLRSCDLVIMLHEHQVVDTGTHAELLQRNELYRHLNYLKYNPFRRAESN